ncbi:small-conductance mechanosensitive channel [Methylohalomonas lacus]|uniref:Small-conductance mechanosensitive channel n=1 Tax=Methylohalomonas lacus TaxID=398773 RepID=A0AAE3HJQ1_9GAMM|nr:mechanosensitive ion channel family protein [Methylohalomonas lacus]MCS3903604.1 small-conductance mechanosensitive channel [Methylohalomonas lacus]
MTDWIASPLEWLQNYQLNLLFSAVVVVVYFIIRRIVLPKLEAYVERDNLNQQTFRSALFTFSLLSAVVALGILLLIWGINIRELLAVSTGIMALTGVALFATWSILSNVTAFFILLSHQSYRRGNYIRVIDVDNYIEGYISEINMFNTILITEDRETVVYPNNLLTARATIINPRDRKRPIGKIEDFRKTETSVDGGLNDKD